MRNSFTLVGVAVGSLALLAAATPAAGQEGVEVVRASRVAQSLPLISMPAAVPQPLEIPVRETRAPGAIERQAAFHSPFSYGFDEALQDSFLPVAPDALPAPVRTFAGMGNTFAVLPPDTTGDVGPAHYVQAVNSGVKIWKKDGTALTGVINLATLFSALGAGSLCSTANDGDPIVLYDRMADRWLISEFAGAAAFPNGSNYRQCIAISQNGDAAGSYWLYDFQWSTTKLNDYPHFGVWPDGYYMTVNQFVRVTQAWGGAGVGVFERSQMLNGGVARLLKVDLSTSAFPNNYGGQLPATWDGGTDLPANTPGIVSQWDDSSWIGDPTDTLRIWRVTVDWTAPSIVMGTNGAAIDPNHKLATADATPSGCTTRNCVPQSGTANGLDAAADGRLMFRMPLRNFGTHNVMMVNNTVGVGTGALQAAPRWYEVRGIVGGTPAIFQQGTYAPDTDHRWMASTAMDKGGNILLGFSKSSASTFPSILYAGRLAGDPAGTLALGEGVLVAGGGSQTHSSNRWGDYSTLSLDPTDDCTFWYTSEYYTASSGSTWATRIGAFRVPQCTGLFFDNFETGGTTRWSLIAP